MVLFLCVLVAFIGLSVRLILINRDKGNDYKKQVLSQLEYDSVTIPFKRGEILDANGTVLAISNKVYNVILDTKVLMDDEENLEPTLNALRTVFNIDTGEVRDYIVTHPNSSYYVLARRLDYELVEQFKELQKDEENGSHIKGIWFEDEYKREYPNGSLACDVIGFTRSDNAGQYGLEEYYNDILCGTNGRQYGYLNDDSNLERTTIPAIDSLIEQAFVDFIDLFRLTASDRLPEYVSNLTSKAESNPEAAEFIYDLADKYIATKDSPMRNEEHHILFLQNAVKSEALGEAGRERAKYRLIAEMKNRPGMTASDFNLETRDGKTSTLSGLLSNDYNLVVFYDPDCNHCLETMDELKKMSLPDTLAIIAIDVVEDKMTWDNTKHSLPEDWTIAFSLDPIQDDELYIFDEMPSLYLIDRSGTILLKDTSCTDIMHTRL